MEGESQAIGFLFTFFVSYPWPTSGAHPEVTRPEHPHAFLPFFPPGVVANIDAPLALTPEVGAWNRSVS